MTQLTKLNDSAHRKLKVASDAPIRLAEQSHLLNLGVTEVAKAVSSFPLFLTKSSHTGSWALSALASFKQGQSLFVEDGNWTATYQPIALQTYPFYLIQSENDAQNFSLGIDRNNPAFSEQKGEALYAADGRSSERLQKITALLEADIQDSVQTIQFARKLEELGLIKPINILVTYSDGSVQTLQGLHTLDEDKIKALEMNLVADLNKIGYLTVMHAMLISLYQLNSLIKKQGVLGDTERITKIKLELARSALVE